MSDLPSILLVEDDGPQAKLFLHYMNGEKVNMTHVASGEQARQSIAKKPPDIVLLDLMLPDDDGKAILTWIRQQQFPTDVVVVTGNGSVDTAVEAMQLGAEDFLEKPTNAGRLRTTVSNLLERRRLKHLVEDYEETFERDRYHGFIGASLPMQSVYRIIDAAAPSNASVFITGESGTGKEVCASAIHAQGNRADKPFIALNCGAIPKDLMESEIFGHTKGAFTGAASDRQGAASQADGGTLFLDEIGEMSMDLQTKLLRFIQTGTFRKVGAGKEEHVDVRFICATNRDPLEAVANGQLREDLYYRLHVVPIHLPALRERADDIMMLASHFLLSYSREEGKPFKTFSPEVEVILRRYHWPGNVRQLQNVIRNIVVLHSGDCVQQHHLPAPLDQAVQEQDISQLSPTINQSVPACSENRSIRSLATIEREAIEQAIDLCAGNVLKAAALLEVSPSTIYRKKQAWESQ